MKSSPSSRFYVMGLTSILMVAGSAQVGLSEDGKNPTKSTSKPATSEPAIPKPKLPNKPFEVVKADAEKVRRPYDAILIWQSYVDNAGPADKLPEAKAELAVWQQRKNDDAERINNKWVGGDELKAIVEKYKGLLADSQSSMAKQQTLEAVKKLQEADKVYPNSYEVKFLLGFVAIEKWNPGKIDNFKIAKSFFEQAISLIPNSPEAKNNLAICQFILRDYKTSILTFHDALKLEDDGQIVNNALWCLKRMPPGIAKAAALKDAVGDITLLASKHESSTDDKILILPMRDPSKLPETDQTEQDRKGVIGSGSGFVISEDGYILTNRHVAKAGNTLMVKRNIGSKDEKQVTAEVIAIDDEQDLALLKIKSDEPLAFVRLAENDNPKDGEDIVLMGYPLARSYGMYESLKITKGIISSGKNGAPFGRSDVTMDIKANHGNSGGPIFDAYGNVDAIIAEITGVGTGGDIYALGISNGRIRKFLEKHDVKLDPATRSASDKPLAASAVSEKNHSAVVLILIGNK